MITFDYAKMEEILMAERLIMKYGKYKGQSMLDIPKDYLLWLQSEKLSQGEPTSSPDMKILDYAIRNSRK